MEKRSFGKLQLNRETLKNLTTGEMKRVVGGTGGCYNTDEWECAATLESACYFCQETATCGCTGICSNGCGSGQGTVCTCPDTDCNC